MIGLIERLEAAGDLPLHSKRHRQRLADLIVEQHPSDSDVWGDGDPAVIVLADVARQGPKSPDEAWGAACDSLGLTPLAAHAIVLARHRQRKRPA